MTEPYLAGQSAIWVQPDGPNTRPEFLGCHQIGELSVPLGELTVQHVPDPASYGKFKPAVSYQAGPGVITSSITTYISATADWLGKITRRGCKFPLYIFKGACGRADVFYGWERGFGLNRALMTQRSFDKLTAREPTDEGLSEQTFNISAVSFHEWLPLEGKRQAVEETEAINSIWACSVPQCPDTCGGGLDPHQNMIVGSDYKAGAPNEPGDVWYTYDQGETWDENWNSPCANLTDDIISVICFPIDATTTRWMVATNDAKAAYEIQYCDDIDGTTWTTVRVNQDAVGVGPLNPRSLFCLDMHHIWLVTFNGHVFFSSDGGASWTLNYEAGLVDLWAIWFSNNKCGMFTTQAAADIMYTKDGGESWHAPTIGPPFQAHDLICVTENAGGGIWWTGSNGGRLYYSLDGGDTWARRYGFQWDDIGHIKSIKFATELTGFMALNLPGYAGAILQTVNGGYSWRVIETTDHGLLNDLTVANENLAFAVGEQHDGTGVILKIRE